MTPEKETPTLKGVEEVVAEMLELSACIEYATDAQERKDSVYSFKEQLRTLLLARDAAHEAELSQERTGFLNKIAEIDKEHEARLREVFKKIINCGSPDRWGVNLVYESEIKEIAAHHGITNL